jgi:hypothetical protein
MTIARCATMARDIPLELAVGRMLQQLDTADYVPLNDHDAPPWFEEGVVVEVDADTWRFLVGFHQTMTFHNDLGRPYFLVHDAAFLPRLCWRRGELYLVCELPKTEADQFLCL